MSGTRHAGTIGAFALLIGALGVPGGAWAQPRLEDFVPVHRPVKGFVPTGPDRGTPRNTPSTTARPEPRRSPSTSGAPPRLAYPSDRGTGVPPAAPSPGGESFGPLHRNVLLAEVYFDQARSAKAAGDEASAESYLERILALEFPPSPRAQYLQGGTHVLMGQLQLSRGQSGPARASARQALDRLGGTGGVMASEAHRLLAILAEQAGDAAAASRHRSAAIQALQADRVAR